METTIRTAVPLAVNLDNTVSTSTTSSEVQPDGTVTDGSITSKNGSRSGDWKSKIEIGDLPVGAEKVSSSAEEDWKRDANHPRNWSKRRKWIAATVVGIYNFMGPLPSAMMAPALPEVAQKYQIANETVLALTLSIFLISYALGPLLLSPLSEMYGRTWILHISNIFNIAFNIGCAFSPNTACLLAMRFLTGFSSSAPVAVGGGSISDLFAENERGSAMALFTIGPLLSPALGPIIGGYITQTLGIKWLFIIIALICSLASVIGLPLLRETYAPVVRWNLAKKSGDLEMARELNPSVIAARGGTPAQVIWVNLSRPMVLLTRSFVCFVLSLYQAFNYGIYYLMFATFAKFFKDTYNFGPGMGGLAYLGLSVGFFISTFACIKYSDKLYMKLAEKNGGKAGTAGLHRPSSIT
ncbi:hypothetical protein EST38_g8972 [Candolleomyces aberdarensis]|uniref:Major facilitator superfamily (MFS) profile domain-containing protein n=1 Tax=Candolleomyces aberdarensis TaxID=2316362 RepID=A0A4Q2DB44_9AGAR|nr:hypothetical protein EST38_g8972 [Candolleomyces aberdarensis]